MNRRVDNPAGTPFDKVMKPGPSVDSRGTRYSVPEGEEYLSTTEVAHLLKAHPQTIYRWCRVWFGDLPAGRQGSRLGYRIPLEYLLIGQVWQQTESPEIRDKARRALLAYPNLFVVVANETSTHYTLREATERIIDLAPDHHAVSLFTLRDLLNEENRT